MENKKLFFQRILTYEKITVVVFLFSLTIPLSTTVATIGSAWSRIYTWDFPLLFMYVLWIIRLKFDERKLRLLLTDIILITLILWFFICNFKGQDPARSSEAWLLWVRSFLIFFYFSRGIGSLKSMKIILLSLLFLVLLEGSLGIIQQIIKTNFGQINSYFGTTKEIRGTWSTDITYIRSTGTFISPNILAAWMMLLLPTLFIWSFYENNKLFKKTIFSTWIIGMLSAISALSRSKLATILVGFFIILNWSRNNFAVKDYLKNPRNLLLTIIFVSVIFVISITAFSGVFKVVWIRYGNMEENFNRKFTQMSYAIEIMKSNPFFGKGQGNYAYEMDEDKFSYLNLTNLRQKIESYNQKLRQYKKKLKNAKKNSKRYNNFLRRYKNTAERHRRMLAKYEQEKNVTCHNIPLKIGAESGVIGLLIFFIFCLYVSIHWFRTMRTKLSSFNQAILGGALTGIICVFIDMQWNTTLTHHSFLPLFFVILGFAFSSEIRTRTHS